jgi:hypothetical protein
LKSDHDEVDMDLAEIGARLQKRKDPLMQKLARK